MTRAAVALAAFVACLAALGGACSDLDTRRPPAPACNVIDLECAP